MENKKQRWLGAEKAACAALFAWLLLMCSMTSATAAETEHAQVLPITGAGTEHARISSVTGAVTAAVLDLAQVCREFERAIENGQMQIAFTTSADYTINQLQQQLSQAAQNEDMLYTGDCTYQKQVIGEQASYTFFLTKDSLLKVKRIKSTAAACKAALQALQNSDYTTRFYSDTSYYSIFYLMLQQHPEYNYNTYVWKKSNGTYGYRRSSELTKSEQDAKMRQADQKAAAFVKNKLSKSMTTVQKLKAIHDYIIRQCQYDYKQKDTDGYEDSFTAYGALVLKKAVCQGYTAAFNLVASKAGFYSIAVCGLANRSSHTWNYVRIGSRSRYIDCTWDKTLQQGDSICYDYFNVGKAVMQRSHAWDTKKFSSKYLAYCKYLE